MPKYSPLRQAEGHMVVGRSSVAALTFLVWDILISLDDEVSLVWSKPHTAWTKWLFLFVRYYTLTVEIATMFSSMVALQANDPVTYSHHTCTSWFVFQETSTLFIVTAVEMMLMLRVRALYDNSLVISIVLGSLFFAEVVTMIIILVILASSVGMDGHCVVIHTPPSFVIFAGAFVGFELILFSLTLYKFIVACKNGWGRTPLLRLVVRDGTWAFVVIFAVVCVNIGLFFGIKGPGSSLGFNWILSAESFAGCRLMLQMDSLSVREKNRARHHRNKNRRTLSESRRTAHGGTTETSDSAQFTTIILGEDSLPTVQTDSDPDSTGMDITENTVFGPAGDVADDDDWDWRHERLAGGESGELFEMDAVRHRQDDLEAATPTRFLAMSSTVSDLPSSRYS